MDISVNSCSTRKLQRQKCLVSVNGWYSIKFSIFRCCYWPEFSRNLPQLCIFHTERLVCVSLPGVIKGGAGFASKDNLPVHVISSFTVCLKPWAFVILMGEFGLFLQFFQSFHAFCSVSVSVCAVPASCQLRSWHIDCVCNIGEIRGMWGMVTGVLRGKTVHPCVKPFVNIMF